MNKKWLLSGVLLLTVLFIVGCYFLFFAPTKFGVIVEVENVRLTTKELNFTLNFLETKQEGITLSEIRVTSYFLDACDTTFYAGDKLHIRVPHNDTITGLPVDCTLKFHISKQYSVEEIGVVVLRIEEGKQYTF